MRINDTLNLKYDYFHNEGKILIYKEQKTKKIRTVYLPNFLTTLINEFIKKRNLKEGNYLFTPMYPSKNNRIKTATIRYHFLKLRHEIHQDKPYLTTKNGINLHRITPHTLKHYGMYKFYNASQKDLVLTQQYSNHSDPKFVIRYIKTLEGINKIGDILQKAYS